MDHLKMEFCDTEFWNTSSTWPTNDPRLSACFRNTALVWLPSALVLLIIICESSNVSRARSKGIKSIPWNAYNITRLSITTLLFLVKCSEAGGYLYGMLNPPTPGSSHLVTSSLTAPIIQATCYLILWFVYLRQRTAGLHTSGSVWFYLLAASAFSSIDLYALLKDHPMPVENPIELAVKSVHLPLLLALFMIECRGDSRNLEAGQVQSDPSDERPECPELRASFVSRLTFWWYSQFLMYGYKTQLTLDKLWRTMDRDKSQLLTFNFKAAWTKSGAKNSSSSPSRDVYRQVNGQFRGRSNIAIVLFKLFWAQILTGSLLKLIQDALQFTTPLLLKGVIRFMTTKEPFWHGILYAILMLIIPTIQSLCLGNYFYRVQVVGINIKTTIIGAIYRKALHLSGNSRLQSTSGEIVNLMAVDSQKIQDVLLHINLIWSAPLQMILAIILLYNELGWPVFAGVASMCLLLPINTFLAKRINVAQRKMMKIKDERIKNMNELLSGIKVVKLYAWENSFMSRLFEQRDKELFHLRRKLANDAYQTFFWQASPFMVAIITFAVYTGIDSENVLNAEKAFVSIALFNLIRFPLAMLPLLVTNLVMTIVSGKRINKFLNNDELVRYVTRNDELEAIKIEGANMSWTEDAPGGGDPSVGREEGEDVASVGGRLVLKDIDFQVKRGAFVAIVGQVASGKSSLISAILGEMHRLSGRFNVARGHHLAYVPQQAWIQNMTVRENILFGAPLDLDRYAQVLDACSLQSDLETLPGGDQAEIGEKGINLSGGQKQRVSLARACYSQSDIYLLDDPLSALDSHVAKHVFEAVLSSSSGLLAKKTRVLATNSLFVLPYVDYIYVLHEGRIVEHGTYRSLMELPSTRLAESMRQYSGAHNLEDMADTQSGQKSESIQEASNLETAKIASAEAKTMKSVPTTTSTGKLVDTEKEETGSVNYRIYLSYFKAISIPWFVVIILTLLLSSAFNLLTNIWLSIWSSDSLDPKKANDDHLRSIRLAGYGALGGMQCLSILLGTLSMCRGAVRASRDMHTKLLNAVIHSPMSFFDTTPLGRIVNRFAKDIDIIDSTIPLSIRSWLTCFFSVASTILLIGASFPTVLTLIVPLGIVYYLIQRIFIVTTRQLKRLESNTRSPIYSHFSETLSGLGSIRAYNCIERFTKISDRLVDSNQSCCYPNITANRWLAVILELFGNLMNSSVALFAVYNKDAISAGVAGLVISYSLSITQTLSWMVRMNSEVETNIVSVERISEYIDNKLEDDWVKSLRPSKEWPSSGSVHFENFSTRYREDTELVLRDVSLQIGAGEKIGVVGRTGSGKSSLSLSLFRILEPASGRIKIDGLDLSQYGLQDIRSKLTIIPQDPVLFSGSLRFNLDPLGAYNDEELWRALELASLKHHIISSGEGLEQKVQEFGENFSLGQRQLICLARAILRKSRILILDEATASIDLATDALVQRTIRHIFADCTIITIAHRLHTILDSDRILVLASGEVREIDKPEKLIEDPASEFASLVRDAGIEPSSIRRLAKQE